jgi:hypothetical protein
MIVWWFCWLFFVILYTSIFTLSLWIYLICWSLLWFVFWSLNSAWPVLPHPTGKLNPKFLWVKMSNPQTKQNAKRLASTASATRCQGVEICYSAECAQPWRSLEFPALCLFIQGLGTIMETLQVLRITGFFVLCPSSSILFYFILLLSWHTLTVIAKSISNINQSDVISRNNNIRLISVV